MKLPELSPRCPPPVSPNDVARELPEIHNAFNCLKPIAARRAIHTYDLMIQQESTQMPGTIANKNAMTHGLYGYFATGSLPPGFSYGRKTLGKIKAGIEQAVLDVSGEISITAAATIQSCLRHEARCILIQRWLRQNSDKMDDTARLAYLRELGNATDARDRCLKSLNLDRAKASIWDSIYGRGAIPAMTFPAPAPPAPKAPTAAASAPAPDAAAAPPAATAGQDDQTASRTPAAPPASTVRDGAANDGGPSQPQGT